MTIKLIKLEFIKLEIVITDVACHGDVISVNSTFIAVVQLIPYKVIILEGLTENATSHCYSLPQTFKNKWDGNHHLQLWLSPIRARTRATHQ